MKFIYYIIFLIIISCSYPDIDTVPKFKKLIITSEEADDIKTIKKTPKELCIYKSKNDAELINCLEPIVYNDLDFINLEINENVAIKLCERLNTDIKKRIHCFVSFYEKNN